MIQKKIYRVIGLMSGTSLDGIDIAYCTFYLHRNKWNYEIIKAITHKYPIAWETRLLNAPRLSAQELSLLNKDYGLYTGNIIAKFIIENNITPDFIASHGHTVFHQPEKSLTVQIGSGAAISAATGLPVVCDFRTIDVSLGGQGAPLVPIGDALLFKDYDICLNIGGFSNVSYIYNNKRISFDICPTNIVLNHFAKLTGKEYDRNGRMAQKGKLNTFLLKDLNNLDFYKMKPPKSLGREWVETKFLKLVSKYKIPVEDILCTLCEHITTQISNVLNKARGKNVLVTGGGAYNTYLITLLQKQSIPFICLPTDEVINYKEALVFAFLGALRWRMENNCLKSVTGASHDNCGGAIYYSSRLNGGQ